MEPCPRNAPPDSFGGPWSLRSPIQRDWRASSAVFARPRRREGVRPGRGAWPSRGCFWWPPWPRRVCTIWQDMPAGLRGWGRFSHRPRHGSIPGPQGGSSCQRIACQGRSQWPLFRGLPSILEISSLQNRRPLARPRRTRIRGCRLSGQCPRRRLRGLDRACLARSPSRLASRLPRGSLGTWEVSSGHGAHSQTSTLRRSPTGATDSHA